MSKIEMFRSILEFIPAENGDLRAEVQEEINKLVKASKPNPTTVACAEKIKEFMRNCDTAGKTELCEFTDNSHQRVQAAANLLEKEGFLTIHPKDENHKTIWFSRN